MLKVMLVEDDNNLREIYEARLKAEGYNIVFAKDGEEALVVAKAEKPDLIISDVMMPKISGFEMLDILRNTDGLKEVKVIMLTALGQSDDQNRATKLGADRYLVKSQVTLEDIVRVTHELLGDAPAAPAASNGAATDPATPAPADPPATAQPVAAPEPTAPAAPAAAPTPAPEPASAPAPAITSDTAAPVPTAPAAEPVATPAPADPPATSSAQQEQADIEAKIEDFVAGADPATPAPADPPATAQPVAAPEPTAPAAPAAAPTPAPEPASAPAVEPDNTVVDKAVDTLMDSAGDSAPATDAGAARADTSSDSDGTVHIANKKVISPLNVEPKKDINALYAIEEAKETASAATAPATPTALVNDGTSSQAAPVVPDPANPAAPTEFASSQGAKEQETAAASSDQKPDPNSIAL